MYDYEAFSNFINYEDIENLRQLYSIFEELSELRRYGNSYVIAVHLDLEEALETIRKDEGEAIKYCLIKGYTYREYREIRGISIAYISKLINSGLFSISKYLTT